MIKPELSTRADSRRQRGGIVESGLRIFALTTDADCNEEFHTSLSSSSLSLQIMHSLI